MKAKSHGDIIEVETSESSSSESDNDDEKPKAKGVARQTDPYANWDNGEPLTPTKHVQLMKLSTYDSQEMNICKRQQMDAGFMSKFKELANNMKQSQAKSPAPRKPKEKPINKEPCHSSRNSTSK
jgi:hypothetical protein